MTKHTNKILSVLAVGMILSMAFIGVSFLTDDEDSSAEDITAVMTVGDFSTQSFFQHIYGTYSGTNTIRPTNYGGAVSPYSAGTWTVSSHGLTATITVRDLTEANVRISSSTYAMRYGCTVDASVSGIPDGTYSGTNGTVDWIYLSGGSNGSFAQTVTVYVGHSPYYVTVSAGTGGTVSGGNSYYANGTTTTITATANSGYTFSQWNDGDTNASRTITVTGNATYTASFVADVWTITYNTDGGNTINPDTVNKGSSYNLPTPIKNGYNFKGWYDPNNNLIGTGGASYTPSANITLTAHWEQVLSISSTPSATSVVKGNTWAYTPTVNATDCTLSLSSNAPSWLSINGSSIHGTPGSSVEPGTYTFTMFCQKANSQTAEQSITLTVVSALTISNPTMYVIAYEG